MYRRDALKALAALPLVSLPSTAKADPEMSSLGDTSKSTRTATPDYASLPLSPRDALERLRSVIFHKDVPAGVGQLLVNPALCQAMDKSHLVLPCYPILPAHMQLQQEEGYFGTYYPRTYNDTCWDRIDHEKECLPAGWRGTTTFRLNVPSYRVHARDFIPLHMARFFKPGTFNRSYSALQFVNLHEVP